MRFFIDRFHKLCGCFIVSGWSESYQPGTKIEMLLNGETLPSLTSSTPNMTLPDHFGPGTEAWGFHVVGVFPDDRTVSSETLVLRFPDGRVLDKIGYANPRSEDGAAHALYWDLVEEIRSSGGTVLELGSRARSGVSSRGTYAPAKHIGCDIVAGENVDVVCDVHELSKSILDTVDFVVSVSVFEHLRMPWKAAIEINRVLKTGGKVFVSSHQAWPLHDIPHDYFRFSDQAWHGIFNAHTGFRIIDTRQGHLVNQVLRYNNPSFDGFEYGDSFAMSVCLAEKIGESLASWEPKMSLLGNADYKY